MSLSNELRARLALDKHGFRSARGLGQNFILDEDFLNSLIDLANVRAGEAILEIGPGAGLMTAIMADRGANVTALEIDKKLEPVLTDVLNGKSTRLVFGDAMREDFNALMGGAEFRVVANLPYYAAFDIILRLLTRGARVTSICAMLQKEACERLTAEIGSKEWCALAATVRYFSDITPLADVPRDIFSPPPHVDSRFIRLDVYAEKPVAALDDGIMIKTINAAFLMRRKTIFNNIKSAFALAPEIAEHVLSRAGIQKNARGETLSIAALARLSDEIYRVKSS